MANKKISDLPLAVAMAGAELFEIDQANVSKRISAVGLFTTVLPGLSIPSPSTDFVVPVRQSSTGAAWGVTISSLMTALHGLPGGGTTGQLLTKLSNADYDTSWVNAGTVFSVGLSLPSIFTVSGSPVTNTGTLTAVLATQSANAVFAGPSSGGALAPTFRLLVGADLPNPSASSLGGVQSLAVVASRWINTISTSGVPSATQPAFTDISGTALVTQGGTGIASGTSGGVPYFSGATSIASSGTLTANALVLGGGAGAAPAVLGSLGTATSVLHGNASGPPTFGAVVLTTDVSGVLPVANGGTGGTLPVSNGGTGQTTLTNHGVLVGAGTAGITQLAMPAGTILVGTSGADPLATATPTLGVTGSLLGTITLSGSASGAVNINPQAAAGTFNFNLPTSAGTAGQPLLSGGGAGAPQTYGTLGVAAGGTGLVSGTSGGVLGFTATGTLASSVLLTANALLLGGGAGATPTPMGSLGTTTTVLHGNAGGAPSFGAVVLTTDVSGTLPVGNGGSGAATFTANGVLLGNGVSALGVTAVGATGSILAGNTSAAPTFQTLSAIIDAATGTTTQGSILFRGASGWTALSPSTSGRVLTTNGAGLDVSWSTVSGTGTVTSISAGTGLATSPSPITTTGTISLSAAWQTMPTIQRFLSGTSATYTTPANCQWIRIRMVGGGSGGGGGGTGGGISGAGTSSTWSGGSLQAGGGGATQQNTTGGIGGTATGGNVANINGSTGWGATNLANTNSVGGANSYFGGGGAGAIAANGGNAVANSGSGGAAGPSTVANAGGSGGGAGGYVEHIITAPAATYTYTVGTGGAGGAAGTSGNAGGAGAAGIIIVEEYYGS
jgi:hypothetical protein